jgi:hypothetical protein
MWRKVVAFADAQEEKLRRLARQHPTDQGNVSAVIRDAVDAFPDNAYTHPEAED